MSDTKPKSIKNKLHSFSYIGGKFFLVAILLGLMPTHTSFTEVFGGSGSFTLNKPKSKVETYNDINSDVVNFFRVLRNKPDALIMLLNLTPYARQEFYSARNYISFETCDLERARKFFVKHQQSFAGRGRDFGYGVMKSQASTFKNKIEKLKAISERLRDVQIENKDFKFIIQRYGKNKDCFLYLDPPYLPETRVSNNDYEFEMSEADHIEMLKLVKKSPAKILISGYSSPLYEKYLKGWNRKEIEVSLFCSTKRDANNEKPRRTEVLWYNYKLPDANKPSKKA